MYIYDETKIYEIIIIKKMHFPVYWRNKTVSQGNAAEHFHKLAWLVYLYAFLNKLSVLDKPTLQIIPIWL